MTDNKSDLAVQRAQLKAELVEEIKRELAPKPQKTWAEIERENAEWRDQMHQLAEKRMSMATPPSALQDLVAAEPKGFMAGVVRDNRNAPTSPTGMIPSKPASGGASAGDGTGYVEPRPLRPPEGIHWVDAQLIADEVRQKAELKRKLGG
jgi:hypothetical protein